jgi:hypothetical protein
MGGAERPHADAVIEDDDEAEDEGAKVEGDDFEGGCESYSRGGEGVDGDDEGAAVRDMDDATTLLATLPMKARRTGYTRVQKDAILSVLNAVKGNKAAALRVVHKKSGFEKVQRSHLIRWLRDGTVPKERSGRRVNEPFERAVLGHLLFTVLEEVDGVKHARIVANIAHSYEIKQARGDYDAGGGAVGERRQDPGAQVLQQVGARFPPPCDAAPPPQYVKRQGAERERCGAERWSGRSGPEPLRAVRRGERRRRGTRESRCDAQGRESL